MMIDWTGSDEGDPIADGMAQAAELNLGLPYALALMAIDRIETTAGTEDTALRDAFLAELHALLDQLDAEGAENV